MAYIAGDYIDKNGQHVTIIPFGGSEWHCVENLRKLAEREGVSIAVRRENQRGDGPIANNTNSTPFITF